MSAAGLNRLVGRAVVSEQFCSGLLGGRREELLNAYDLSADERDSVIGIQAEKLPEFAAAVDRLVVASQNKGTVPQWVPSPKAFIWGVREPNEVARR